MCVSPSPSTSDARLFVRADEQRYDGEISPRISATPVQWTERVFDLFFMAKLGQGGLGRTMHSCDTLVTVLLGGTITRTSTPGQGTNLLLHMPLVAPRTSGDVLV